jgi:hypothetical protein
MSAKASTNNLLSTYNAIYPNNYAYNNLTSDFYYQIISNTGSNGSDPEPPAESQVSGTTSGSQAISAFTVNTSGNSTYAYSSFLTPTSGTSIQVITFTSYDMEMAVDSSGNLMYFKAMFDFVLNTPTNPSSSAYNIYLNLMMYGPYGPIAGSSENFNIPNWTTSKTTINNVFDAVMSVSSSGQTSQTGIFTLNQTQILQYTTDTSVLSSSNFPTSFGTTTPFNTQFTVSIPFSSIFPNINTAGVVYRGVVELFPYT